MKSKALTFAVLMAATGYANAGIISQDVSFGTLGSSTDVQLGGSQSLMIDRFDSSIGLLDSVTIQLFGQIDSSGSSQNVSEADGRADVGIFLISNWGVNNQDVGFSHTFQDANFSTPFLTDESSPEGTYTLSPDTPEDTFSYSLSSGLLQAAYNSFDVDLFTTANDTDPLEFIFSAFANTTIDNDVESGTGRFVNSFNSGNYGRITVDYNYSESVPEEATSVSEPASAAILGLGLEIGRAHV